MFYIYHWMFWPNFMENCQNLHTLLIRWNKSFWSWPLLMACAAFGMLKWKQNIILLLNFFLEDTREGLGYLKNLNLSNGSVYILLQSLWNILLLSKVKQKGWQVHLVPVTTFGLHYKRNMSSFLWEKSKHYWRGRCLVSCM